MAKDEIDRAARAGADDVAGNSKQQEIAALLKKMKVVSEADVKAAHSADNHEAPVSSEAQSEAQTVASADGIFASDAATEVASASGLAASDAGGSEGGISTGTLLAIGGVALVAGGVAIAANNDSGGGGKSSKVTAVTPSVATVDEGQTVTFTVTGKPGSTFSYTLTGSAANADDISSPLAGSVTIGDDGTAVVSVSVNTDTAVEGPESLTLTVGGQTSTVTVNDILPPAQNADLTTGTDTPNTGFDFTGTSGANVVSGVAAGGNAGETFTVGDHVVGNGETILELKVADGTDEAVVSLENLGAINLVNAAGATTANFNATLWDGIGSINLVDGADDLKAVFDDLQEGTDLTIAAGVAGTLVANFTDEVTAELYSDHNGSLAYVAGNVDAVVAASESATFNLIYSGTGALDLTLGNVSAAIAHDGVFNVNVTDTGGAGAITVGDISATGAAVNTEVNVLVTGTATAAGNTHDMAIGDVNVALGKSGSVEAYFYNDGFDVVGNFVGGDVSIAVGDGGYVDYSAWNWTSNAPSLADISVGDFTLGNISISGGTGSSITAPYIGNFAYTAVGASADAVAGDVIVGNVTLSVGDDSTQAAASIYNSASATAASATAGDTTVGNIAITSGAHATDVYVEVNAWAFGGTSAVVGASTVGDVEITTALGGTGNFYNYHEATASAGEASVGATTVGNVTVSAETDSVVDVYNYISASAHANAAATVGDIQIGDVGATLNVNAAVTNELYAYAYATGTGVGTIGDVSVGSQDVTLNDGAHYSYYASIVAEGAGAGTGGAVGDVSFGNISVDAANGVSSEADVYAYASASYGDLASYTVGDIALVVGENADLSATFQAYGANVGAVEFGDVDVTMLGSGSADILITADAYSGELASVALGNISVAAVSSDTFDLTASLTAANGIGPVTVGDINLSSVGDSVSASVSLSLSVTQTGDIADVVLGDITLLGSGSQANASVDLNLSAYARVTPTFATSFDGGSAGNVTVGDISLTAMGSSSCDANVTLNVTVAGDVGDITVGSLDIVSIGENAEAGLYVSVSSSGGGDLGTVRIGNVSIDSQAITAASNSNAALYVHTLGGVGLTGGDIVVGDIAVNVDAGEDMNAYATIDLSAQAGNITVGDIDLNFGSPVNATDTAVNTLQLSISAASGDVSLGVISVSGGGFTYDSFATFTALMAGVTAGAGNVSIDGVDYSGFTPDGTVNTGAIIDVTGFDVAGTIIGSAFDDLITDNADTNVITGGAGADTFTFNDTNTGLTAATADQITDWSHTEDSIVIETLANPLDQTNYTEGTYADFASFLAAADAADKEVSAGLVGGNTFLAVDFDNSGSVDYVIELVGTNLGQIDISNFGP